jgi:hypothetical protein
VPVRGVGGQRCDQLVQAVDASVRRHAFDYPGADLDRIQAHAQRTGDVGVGVVAHEGRVGRNNSEAVQGEVEDAWIRLGDLQLVGEDEHVGGVAPW